MLHELPANLPPTHHLRASTAIHSPAFIHANASSTTLIHDCERGAPWSAWLLVTGYATDVLHASTVAGVIPFSVRLTLALSSERRPSCHAPLVCSNALFDGSSVDATPRSTLRAASAAWPSLDATASVSEGKAMFGGRSPTNCAGVAHRLALVCRRRDTPGARRRVLRVWQSDAAEGHEVDPEGSKRRLTMRMGMVARAALTPYVAHS